jgi:D-alanyl-D-alanine carboxypeptidase (penicillin-binding protein 5/6)
MLLCGYLLATCKSRPPLTFAVVRRPLTTIAMVTAVAIPGVMLPPGATAADSPRPSAQAGPVGGPKLTGDDVVTDTDMSTPPPPTTKATSWLVADLATGEVLAAKAPHVKLKPASVLTTLTALVLLPRLNKDETVFGEDADVAVEGSKVGVAPGVRYSIDQLFQALFLSSAPDAAHTLARYDDGGISGTVKRMNAKAKELGALDTQVLDPAGVDKSGQVTSTYDLAVIAREAMQRPDFSTYVATKTAKLPQATGGPLDLTNQNRLLWSYPGALGVKTGYSNAARNAMIGAAERDGRRLVVTVLDGDTRVIPATEDLLDWAFANRTALRPIGTLNATGEVTAPKDRDGGMTAGGILHVTQHKIGPVPTWVLGALVLALALTGWRVLGAPARAAAAADGALHRRARHRARRARRRVPH